MMKCTQLASLIAILGLGLAACAQHPPAETRPAEDPGEERKDEIVTVRGDVIERVDPETGMTVLEPADGVWHQTEDGREYFVRQVPRVEGGYRLLDDGARVRLPAGLIFDLEDLDEHSFHVRIYRIDPAARSIRIDRPSPEDLERVAAEYRHDLRVRRTLRVEDFGNGLPQYGQWRDNFALADIDGDGHLDIVHGPPRRGTEPVILLGDGRGNWRHWEETRFVGGPTLDYGGVAVADFNGNGQLDIAFASHLRGVQVFVHAGDGTFTAWSRGLDWWRAGLDRPEDRGVTTKRIVAVDWTGDGRKDLLAISEGPSGPRDAAAGIAYGVVAFLNQGDGSWKRRAPNSPARVFGDDLVVADFTGDGGLDFVTGSNVRGQRALFNRRQPDGTWEAELLDGLRPRATVRALAAGDLDGSGRLDLIVGYLSAEQGVPRAGIDVLYAQPDGGWERRTLFAEEGFTRGVSALALGDFDGDGAKDLVALTRDGRTWIFRGDGRGFFWREELGDLDQPQQGCIGFHVEVADLNGDGSDEIVAAFAGDDCPNGGSLRAWRVARGR